MVKSGLEFFILKSYMPLQSCCCPVQKNLPRNAKLTWLVSRYLWSQKSSLPIFVTYPLAWNSILQTFHFMLCLLKRPYRENQKSFLQLLFKSWSMVSNIFEFSSFNTFLSTYNRIPSKSQICWISRYEVCVNITF